MKEDEFNYIIHTFGRKINKEEEGYTDVDWDGVARPVLKIPSDIPKGRRRLTAVYTDERQEIYQPSLARTWLIYGSKAYVHCPTIYHQKDLEDITLLANIFSNNRPVPGGYAKFKIQNKTVSSTVLPVKQGHVEETHHIRISENKSYQCPYEGSETWKISEARGEGMILLYELTRIPLVVDVLKLICNEGESTKLVARVYRREHGKVVNYMEDSPEDGRITFYIDGEQVFYGDLTHIPIDKNGFATIPIIANQGIGVHEITAVYDPYTDEMKEKYMVTYGANTLFIGNDTNKPILTQVGKNCGVRGQMYTFEFNSNRELNGKIRIFIDGISIRASECEKKDYINFFGNYLPLYEQEVLDKDNFTFTIVIPHWGDTSSESIWGYSGYHNMIIEYIEYDEELGDMEYWYIWDDFYIQIDTRIYIDDEWMDNTKDGDIYTGNNMYIKENNETIHWKPGAEIPTSVVVGNPMKIRVENVDDFTPIRLGKVKVTVTSRKKENW